MMTTVADFRFHERRRNTGVYPFENRWVKFHTIVVLCYIFDVQIDHLPPRKSTNQVSFLRTRHILHCRIELISLAQTASVNLLGLIYQVPIL